MNTTSSTCQATDCDQPTHDTHRICNACIRDFTKTLNQIPWLLAQLHTAATQQVRFTTQNQHTRTSGHAPLPLNLKAAEARTELITTLEHAVKTIATTHRLPVGDHTLVRFLNSHTNRIQTDPAGPAILNQIKTQTRHARHLIDRPAPRHYLGQCADNYGNEHCPGDIYARSSQHEARCDTCGLTWNAEDLRTHILNELNNQLLTAAEIVNMSAYLGLTLDRKQVRKRVNQWATRGRITGHQAPLTDGEPGATQRVFRFGEVLALLAQDSATRSA